MQFSDLLAVDVRFPARDIRVGQRQILPRQPSSTERGMAKARASDRMQALGELTRVVDGRPRIIADPPLLVPITDLLPEQTDQAAFAAQIKDLLGKYRRTLETDRRFLLDTFEFADLARKVGVGSVGTRAERGGRGSVRRSQRGQSHQWSSRPARPAASRRRASSHPAGARKFPVSCGVRPRGAGMAAAQTCVFLIRRRLCSPRSWLA
jgi:hypothetical protein